MKIQFSFPFSLLIQEPITVKNTFSSKNVFLFKGITSLIRHGRLVPLAVGAYSFVQFLVDLHVIDFPLIVSIFRAKHLFCYSVGFFHLDVVLICDYF